MIVKITLGTDGTMTTVNKASTLNVVQPIDPEVREMLGGKTVGFFIAELTPGGYCDVFPDLSDLPDQGW